MSNCIGYTRPFKLDATLVTMPDAFTFLDGSFVSSLVDWKRRQEEIANMYQYYVYGIKRCGERVSYENLPFGTIRYFDWASRKWVTTIEQESDTKKFVKLIVKQDNKEGSYEISINLPSADGLSHKGGYPVFIEIGRLNESVRTYLHSKGYATIEFCPTDVASDDDKHIGAFYNLYEYGSAWEEQTGVLMAWGWGVSKIIDFLERAGVKTWLGINPHITIVNGVSRYGKAAAVAGAFDHRITVTAPACSGAGGMTAFRYVSEGLSFDYSSLRKEEFIDFQGEKEGTATWEKYQTQEGKMHTVSTNQSFTHFGLDSSGGWVNENYKEFTDVRQFPLDQHLLASLCAEKGRYVYITTEVVGGDWINGAGTYATYLEATKIFKALGLGDQIKTHIHAVGHAFTKINAEYLIQFCEQNLYNNIRGERDLTNLTTSVYEDNGNRIVFDTVYNCIKSHTSNFYRGNYETQ